MWPCTSIVRESYEWKAYRLRKNYMELSNTINNLEIIMGQSNGVFIKASSTNGKGT